MKKVLLLSLLTVFCISACNKKSLAVKYAISYLANHKDGYQDGIVIAECEKPYTQQTAKVAVKATIAKLENIHFDTAKITILDIRKVGNETLDDGYRIGGHKCDCNK